MTFPARPTRRFSLLSDSWGVVTSPRRTALAVALLFGLVSVLTFATPSHTSAWGGSSFSSASEAELVTLTNRARANAGLPSLRVDSALTSVARWRSKDMIDRNYFSHDIPGYGKVWDKLAAINYCYHVGGENIGWDPNPDDTATAVIQSMFMNSPGHRANILGTGWDVIGIGAYKSSTGKKMWTVLFADKCGTSPGATPKPTARPTARPTSHPTARPTAHPTARPTSALRQPIVTPEPTSQPTPTEDLGPTPDPNADPTTPISTDQLVDPSGDPGAQPTDATSAPSDDPAGTPLDGAVGMRVVDRGTSNGLLETIVGGVAGFFFGA